MPAKRDMLNQRAAANPLDMAARSDHETASRTVEEAAQSLWGGGLDPEERARLKRGKRERIEAVDIFSIQPDPAQPRRAIPGSVRGDWQPNSAEMPGFLAHWRDQSRLNVAALLDGESELPDHDALPPHTLALLHIVELAISIQSEGLVNPVSLVDDGKGGYRLETGERRWLAYHLLHLQDTNGGATTANDSSTQAVSTSTWARIPARIMPESDPFRQAAENAQRADLNAIGRARQYAILMMALHPEVNIIDYTEAASDRDYYAQALQFDRIPYGKGKQLYTALGVKDRSVVTRCRKLLELPDAMWQQGDDENWPEDDLLAIVGIPNNVEMTPRKGMKKRIPETPAMRFKKHASFLTRKLTRVETWSAKRRQEALDRVAEMRAYLDEVEDQLKTDED